MESSIYFYNILLICEYFQPSTSTGKAVVLKKPDEYDHDTSDEEDIRNTTGNVPKHWLILVLDVLNMWDYSSSKK